MNNWLDTIDKLNRAMAPFRKIESLGHFAMPEDPFKHIRDVTSVKALGGIPIRDETNSVVNLLQQSAKMDPLGVAAAQKVGSELTGFSSHVREITAAQKLLPDSRYLGQSAKLDPLGGLAAEKMGRELTGFRGQLGAVAAAQKMLPDSNLMALVNSSSKALGWMNDENSVFGQARRLGEVTAPLGNIFERARRLQEQLEEDQDRFKGERKIWLPDDEDVEPEVFSSLVVPNTGVSVVEGTLQLALMAAILRHPENLYQLTDRQFEFFVADLLADQGYTEIYLTPRSGDGGKDIVACRLVNGRPSTVYVECKHYRTRHVGRPDMLMLYGAIQSDNIPHGLMVTSGTRLTKGGVQLKTKHSDKLDAKVREHILGWVQDAARKRSFKCLG